MINELNANIKVGKIYIKLSNSNKLNEELLVTIIKKY